MKSLVRQHPGANTSHLRGQKCFYLKVTPDCSDSINSIQMTPKCSEGGDSGPDMVLPRAGLPAPTGSHVTSSK